MANVFVTSYTNGGRTVEGNFRTVGDVLDNLGVMSSTVSYRVYNEAGVEQLNKTTRSLLHNNDEVDVQRKSTKSGIR